jgi:protein-disulfide isomerase
MNRKTLPQALFALLLVAPVACNQAGTKNASTSSASDSQVVAMIGKSTITMAEVDKAAGRELFDVREKALESLVTDRVLADAAKATNVSVDDMMKKAVETRVPEVSVDEAKTFFEQNKARLGGGLADKPFDEVKTMIVQGLTGQKRREAVGQVIEEIKSKAGVKVMMRAPKLEVAAEGPMKGPATAKVTIVEFSDFQCPFCSRGKKTADEVVAKYGDKVRLVFRDFPLDFHDKAQKAAEAGHCAQDQGKFWQMHDWMFDNQDKLDVEALKGAAKTLGIDSAKFDTCLTGGQHAEDVKRNMRDGQKVGVRGTPAFFINGVMLSGAQPFEKFKEEIDRALAD